VTELPKIFAEFTPGAYGIWSGVLMFAAWWLREWRETRKLSADDRQARREGYAKQVENLQGENRRLRTDLTERDRVHDEYRHACQAETDQLRQEIRGLEDQVTGLKRRIDAQAGAVARAVTDGLLAPSTTARMTRTEKEE
jgi:chromosome segregation ATPase